MSHRATNWLATLEAGAMTHGEFRVMFHLCDCHNPAMGCYPSQAYLRAHTGLSNGGLNRVLLSLEGKSLLQRERRVDPKTKRKTSTLYILGCDKDLTQEPSPLSGVGSISTFDAEPSPLLAQSHLHPGGDKPVKEPVKEPCAADATHKDFDFQDFLWKFAEVYPRTGDMEAVEAELTAALQAGVDPEHLLSAAKSYAVENEGNSRQYIAFAENWLRKERWKEHAKASPKATEADILSSLAASIKDQASWVTSTTSANKARKMIDLGLVTEAECKAVGIL